MYLKPHFIRFFEGLFDIQDGAKMYNFYCIEIKYFLHQALHSSLVFSKNVN